MIELIAANDSRAMRNKNNGRPQNSAPIIAPNIPRANTNGMF